MQNKNRRKSTLQFGRKRTAAVFGVGALLLACSEPAAPESEGPDGPDGIAAETGGAASGAGGGTAGATAGTAATASGTGGGTAGATAGTAATASGTGGGTAGAAAGAEAGTAATASGTGGGTAGAAAGTGGTISIPTYSLRVDAPESGMTVGGVVTVSGFAPGFVNVEVWDGTHQQPPLAQTTPGPDGAFSTTVDTASLANGPTTWTVWAWDSPPGQSFTHDASVDLSLAIDQTFGSGGAGGEDGCTPKSDAQLCQDAGKNCDAFTTTDNCGQSRTVNCGSCSGTCTDNVCQTSVTDGRNFLLGMFNSGSEIPSYFSYLGYHPEVTYNSSYQDGHHKERCGQPISGLNEINSYPVIISVFTYNADYAGTAQGNHDNCYEELFQGLESKADTIYGVRIDVEFWPHPPASEFKGSFNRIVSIAKRHLPARIKYIFNPNWDAGLEGADYVPESADVIGPDAYNNPQWCSGKSSAQCAADKFDPNRPGSIAYWTKIAQQLGKPMALPEWGDDYGDGAYITAVADWAFDTVLVTPGMSNNVVYLGYWDSDYNEDAHLRGNAKTLFQQRFANIPYSGTYWGPLIPTTSYSNF